MLFYEYIYILCHIFISFRTTYCLHNEDLRTVATGVEEVSPRAVGLKFYATVNNTSVADDYDLELLPDQCCIEIGSILDCDVIEALGSCVGRVLKGSIVTLNLVAPILDPYERKGYCIAYLDSKAVLRKRNVVTMRDTIKIPFDTRLKYFKHVDLPFGVKHCKRYDEDPLNKCLPVVCEVFYNGKKSFYDKVQKRCIEVPSCISEQAEIPNTIYNPTDNKCIQEDPITNDDINYIKDLKHRNKNRIIKDIVIIKKFKESPVNNTDYYNGAQDNSKRKFSGKVKPKLTKETYIYSLFCDISKNKTGVTFLILIILVQCGTICTMLYFLARRCLCKKKSKILEKKFFNYRQDASVTTPLIGITNVDTETTCQYMSESSHIDTKIQSYKACQKDNAKTSLSDDILSKCLNRRNWDRKQVRSEAVDVKTRLDSNDGSNIFETLYMSTNIEDQKVIFEDNAKKDKKAIKSIVKKSDKKTAPKKIEEKKSGVTDVFISEQEMQCITYNYDENRQKIAKKNPEYPMSDVGCSEREIRCHNYNYGFDVSDTESHKASSRSRSDTKKAGRKHQVYTTEITKANSNISRERQASAQASFTNDSVDDYLSERGMLFLTGENISKYSFSEGSLKSSVSSRTSKNNIMKHVMSYLKRDKHGPSSDPGAKKHDEVNLELIHMSKATMYSSSNNDECLKNITRVKDSRTSL